MEEEKQPQWEIVDRGTSTQRLKVPGGWIYRYGATHPAMCFVPKPSNITKIGD